MTPYDDEVLRVTRDELQRTVKLAATKALTQHRRRSILVASLVTFTICCAVFLTIALIARHDIEKTDHRANAYACKVSSDLSMLVGDFVGSDGTLRYRQARLKVTQELVAQLGIPPAELKRAVAASTKLSDHYADYWYFVLQPDLKALGHASCDALNGG